jgi:hypothetical protein
MSDARKRWPILTVAGLLLPAIFVGAAFMPSTGGRNEGGWGLGEIFIFAVLILSGAALGAVSSALALLRREPWRPLQVIVLLANAGFLLWFGVLFFRKRPEPSLPMGEPAYLMLAPAAERVAPRAIVLAYPAPASAAAERGYVIGLRDSLGVVTSLRTADFSVPLQPGELRMQLSVVDGRWALDRTGDYVRKLPDRRWRQAAYAEIRVTQLGWGVPVGVADRSFLPLDSPR